VSDIKARIHDFVMTTYLPGEPADSLRTSTPLQTSGILDSMAVLTLVAFLEREFSVELDVFDTSADRFDRIDDIATLVARKQAVRLVAS
jgi:acyl carrier protein